MNITHKDAAITNTGAPDDFPGTFQVVLSTPAKDRDGDELASEDWKTPLPDHITFDTDHGMSVASTVGSGAPHIDEKGRMIVDGTYSSLDRAQECRTLVNEGHIKTTSVAFMSEKVAKDGKSRTVRELLNGAFVAIPSNREALVLSSKALKAGARHSAADAQHVQAIHDHALALGAKPAGPDDSTGADTGAVGGKTVGDAADSDDDPGRLAQAVDAALDEAMNLLAVVDLETLPAEVQQAVGLLTAAEETVDELLEALGVTDPDDDAPAAADETTAAPDAAVAKSAAAEADLALQVQAIATRASAWAAI